MVQGEVRVAWRGNKGGPAKNRSPRGKKKKTHKKKQKKKATEFFKQPHTVMKERAWVQKQGENG